MNGFSLRLATLADAEEILGIYAPYILNTPITFEDKVPDLAEFTQRMKSVLSVYPYIVAESPQGIVGYAYVSPHRSRSAYRWNVETSIYIAQGYQGQGLGTQMYKTLFRILSLAQIENAYACITYPNPQSIAFHKAMGFEEVGHFPKTGFKAGAWHDVVWLELKIGEGSAPKGEIVPVTDLAESINKILKGEI